jgi:tRNA U55 pseudouridine synthase TruB
MYRRHFYNKIRMKIINKPIGITPNQLRLELIESGELSKQSCYAGRLDPMARGKMLFLEKEELKDMDMYLQKSKTYQFEVILGLSTDTDDIMGLLDTDIQLLQNIDYMKSSIEKRIHHFKTHGQNTQKYHPYSSFVLKKNGIKKQLWKWNSTHQLTYDELPSKKVSLYDIQIVEYKEYNGGDFFNECIHRVDSVDKSYSFRQMEIIEQWKSILKTHGETVIYSIKMELSASSGYYIRQFGYDLKHNISFPLLIYDIHRTDLFT